MAALGWLMNLGFAAGQAFVPDSRELPISADVGNRIFTPAARISCDIASSNRTFTPADE